QLARVRIGAAHRGQKEPVAHGGIGGQVARVEDQRLAGAAAGEDGRDLRAHDRLRIHQARGERSACSRTGSVISPTDSIAILTVSPGPSGPTPAGVPLAITSPGRKVTTDDTSSISSAMPTIMSRVF